MIERERPDAILPTLGGQTALNIAMDLAKHGVLEKYGCEMIGANPEVIHKAQAPPRFLVAMEKTGNEVLAWGVFTGCLCPFARGFRLPVLLIFVSGRGDLPAALS